MTTDSPAWPVRPATLADCDAFGEVIRMSFGATHEICRDALLRSLFETGAALVAHEPGEPERLVGVSAHTPVQISFPHKDGAAPHDVHGLTWVGVRPDRRRRGVLRALMGAQLVWARDHNLAWSALTASEAGIYGRFGYGNAVTFHGIEGTGSSFGSKDSDKDDSADDASYQFDLMPLGEEAYALHRQVWEQHATRYPGSVTVGSQYVQAGQSTDQHDKKHHPESYLAAVRKDGEPVAAGVVARVAHQPGAEAPTCRQFLSTIVSVTDEARIMLAKKVCSFDLVGNTRLGWLSGEDALIWAGDGPTDLELKTSDGVWLRPVHLDAALRSLYWRDPITMVIELSDPVPGTVTKVLVQESEPGTATVEATEQAPDLTVSSALLGALSCGNYRPHGALQHGTFAEHRTGAAMELATALRGVKAPGGVVWF